MFYAHLRRTSLLWLLTQDGAQARRSLHVRAIKWCEFNKCSSSPTWARTGGGDDADDVWTSYEPSQQVCVSQVASRTSWSRPPPTLPPGRLPAADCGRSALGAGMATGASAAASCRLSMDYEAKVFPQTGGYGRYNRVAVVFSWFPTFAVMLNLFSDVFYTLIPGAYRCKPDPELLPSSFMPSNYSAEGYLNLTVPWVKGSGLSHCELYRYPANTSELSGEVPRTAVPCTRGWEYSAVAGLQSNFVTEWNLVCDDYWKVPLQHICFMMGWIVGYVFLGSLCDWLGRRRGFLLSITLSSLFGVAVCLSSSAVVFLLLRLCQGAMLAGVFVSSYILSKSGWFIL
uniref:Major facilitator superfamily (MFS) profile domain-containing protein n=1 Tax=Fundulus heteroclitus TaxID=8078 RepID=A0A3Q2PV16_FUNHE